jgi:pilus assembly protein CpaB
MLVGVFLAVIAFVGVLVLSQGGNGTDPDAPPTTKVVVIAKEDIPLGTVMQQEMLDVKTVEIAGAETGAYADVSQVIGQVARQEVLTGAQITTTTTSGGLTGTIVNLNVEPGYRAMSVLVDQVSGVGTLIKTGDYVDMVIRMDIKPTVINEAGTEVTTLEVDGDTTKLILQGMQVLGVLLPPVAAPADGEAGATPQPGTALQERQELVILGLTPEQVEVVKWVQNEEQVSVSLVLRSPEDFVDAEGNRLIPESPCVTVRPSPTPTPLTSPEPGASPEPVTPFPCEITPGIVLSELIDRYGVIAIGIEDVGFSGASPSPSPAP